MNTSNNEVSLVRGGDDRITELIKLLQLSATFDDEKVLNIVKESNIQVMLKLRKNRWSKDEVEYAQFLIEEFDSGLSKGLKNGHTKRSYLSEKLMCAPMRVSKKFPSKSIGKTNFSRVSIGPDGRVLDRFETRHNELRIKFLRTILPAELKNLLAAEALKRKLAGSSLSSRKRTPANNTETPSPAMMLFQGPISVQTNSATAQQETSHQNHAPLTNTINPVPFVAPPTMVVPLLFEQKPCPSASAGPPPFFIQHAGFDKSAVSQDRKPKSILSNGNFRPDHNDIPDLLSGFDKHAASLLEQKEKYVSISIHVPTKQTTSDNIIVQASEHPLFVGPIGESPYITSKSFDELHKCLATNEIPHLDLSIGPSMQQDEQRMNVPVPSMMACGVPIQVSTNNCPGAFAPFVNQQNYSQPMHMASFTPQLQNQMVKQCIPPQQFKNVAALPMVQTSRYDVAEVVPPRKSFGALSIYNQNGTRAPISNDIVAAAHLGGGTKKRSPDESGLSFHSLLSDGTKRFKASRAVSTTSGSSEPSSSDGGFDSVLSSYENSSSSSKTHSKQGSNHSDSSETD